MCNEMHIRQNTAATSTSVSMSREKSAGYIIWLHHLDEHSLVEGSKPFGMSHHGNLPWSCHVEMQLGNVDALPDFFDMALVGDHLHVGHPGTRHNLSLLNRQALWIC